MPKLDESRSEESEESPASGGGELPIRWLLIIITAVGVGLLVGQKAGLFAALTVALILVGLLHTILPKGPKS